MSGSCVVVCRPFFAFVFARVLFCLCVFVCAAMCTIVIAGLGFAYMVVLCFYRWRVCVFSGGVSVSKRCF